MSFNIDPKGVLIDSLKQKRDDFEVSNIIFPNKNAIRAVFEVESIYADMIEFAKNPEIGLQHLGPPPVRQNLTAVSDEEAERAELEYLDLQRYYELEKHALTNHVTPSDMSIIAQFKRKFELTLAAISGIKGKRFFAFTKTVEEREGSFLDLFRRGQQPQ